MEFAQLEALVTIARARSFSRAAEQLARTQPALSIAIRKLEEEVGAVLFDRSQKEVTLTEVGQILFEYAQKILNLRREALGTIEELRQLHTGRVTIGANESTSLYLLPRIILAFREQYPTIKIEVYRSFSERLPREIKERNLDFGIVSFDPSDRELASFPILEDELVLILPPGHPLAARERITLRDLGGEPFIAHNVRSPARERVIQAFRRARVPLNIVIELTSIETIKEFVKMGLGLAFVPRMCITEELEHGKLATVPIHGFRYQRVLRVIYLRDKVHSHAAQKFLEVLKAMAPNARGRRARLTGRSLRPIV